MVTSGDGKLKRAVPLSVENFSPEKKIFQTYWITADWSFETPSAKRRWEGIPRSKIFEGGRATPGCDSCSLSRRTSAAGFRVIPWDFAGWRSNPQNTSGSYDWTGAGSGNGKNSGARVHCEDAAAEPGFKSCYSPKQGCHNFNSPFFCHF